MTVIQGLLQGVLQGLSEFLPISSSGHLVLFQHFTGTTDEGSLFFNLMLHLGTLAAVFAAYWEDLWALIKEVVMMVKEMARREFHWKTERPARRLLYMLFFGTLPMVLIIPLRGLVSNITTDNDIVVEGVCFLITAGLLFLACKTARKKGAGIERMKPRQALAIGVMQSFATLPGISRSGSTLSTGLFLGFDKAFMVKYSFLLGIPAILGGAVFEIGDAVKEEIDVKFSVLFVGMLAAALVGYAAIRFIKWLVVSDKLIIFAWYTLVLGAVVVIIGIVEHIARAAGGDAGGMTSGIIGMLPLFLK